MKKTSTLFTKLVFTAFLVLCISMTSKAVCVANYTFTISGATVTFTNTSTGFGNNTIWSWTFGDTQGASTMNASHTYAAGTYTCCVYGVDPVASCADSACHVFTITTSGITEFQTVNGSISNYPNPFSGSTTIRYITGEVGSVEISVYDVLGNKVASIENSNVQVIGKHETPFDASSLSQGIYFLRFTLNGRSVTEKMTITK